MPDTRPDHDDGVAVIQQPVENESEILRENTQRVKASFQNQAAPEESNESTANPPPKLSQADFKVYNSMAETMEYFHNHFRETWTLLYTACTSNKRPGNMSLRQFISTGIQFCRHLTTHHGIEERHIFPVLARKMPEFKQGKDAAELLRQHEAIHDGMHVFEDYLNKCLSGETELDLRLLKEKMDTWGDVLWKHLDQEVVTLGAENMRKYWTLGEMRRMPM